MRPANPSICHALRTISFGILICLLANTNVSAAGTARDYLTHVWTSENGLPDNSVTAIAQTPDGYLWIGTFNGLARFDGVRFVTFDPANTPALLHAHIRHLYVDSQGTLWINTYDGSLTRYSHGQFILERRNTRLSEGEVTLVSSSSNDVVFLMSRGEVLRKSLASSPEQGWEELAPPHRGLGASCCEDSSGVIWYQSGDGHFYQLVAGKFIPQPDNDPFAGTNLNCMATDSKGRLWVGSNNGLAFWNGTRFEDATPANSALRPHITSLYVAADGAIWAIANGCVCEAMRRQWVLPPDPSRSIFADGSNPIGMQEDHQGGIWCYSNEHGLVHVSSTGSIHQLTSADDFPDAQIYCGFDDHEGDLWTGQDAGGLVRVREAQFHIANLTDTKAAESVCQDSQGTVWVGLASAGLGRLNDEIFTNSAVTNSDGTALDAYCVCADARGRLWISGNDENLYVGDGNHFDLVQPPINRVKALLAARNGRVWVGATSGLYFTDGGPDQLQFFKALGRHSVRAMSEDKAGTLWAGSGNGYLYHIDNGKVTTLQPGTNQESDAVWSVLADDDGTVWVGTFRDGLFRYRNSQFTRYGKVQGLPDNVICQILDDGQGNLWIGSHQGVFRVSKSALDDVASGKSKYVTCVAYDRSDGLPSIECSGGFQPSAWRDTRDRLWFTTASGAAWIQPQDVHPDLTPPPVVIEEALVDGVQTNLQSEAGPPALQIPPGKHQIEIHYTGLSLVSPERVQFRYQLEDVESAWTEAGSQRFAQYNFLPPGKYLFHVLACNSDGVWNRTGAVLALDVLPYFYQTWWFDAVAVFAVLAIVAGIVRHTVTRRLRLKMEQLERHKAIELERSRIAKDIHDDLGASLTLIAVLGDLAKKEKTAERIEKISGTAREAVKSLDEIVWAVNPRNDTLSHLVDYTGQFATDYLRDAGIRCLLDVPDSLPAREVPANVRHNVFLVVKEALQNIVKHARANTVWLRINTDGQGLHIGVEDNGCGFDQSAGDPWANGLRNMRQRLAEIGGDCRIQSRPGAGTTITVDLPFPQN
ncbi:MAG TPA: two-component regulator propeller domain-containing protein [Verrucomicrobiae bacterium]|jgi:ligand-binding sensor domain-containing protein/signal transduction histidine kinase